MANNMNRVKSTSDLELKDRLVAVNRVTKVTKGGRTFSFSAIVVVGSEDGIIGWGLGKAGEVTAAIAKGTEAAQALKNIVAYGNVDKASKNEFDDLVVIHKNGLLYDNYHGNLEFLDRKDFRKKDIR